MSYANSIVTGPPPVAPSPAPAWAVGRKALHVVKMGTVDRFGHLRQLQQATPAVPFGTAMNPYELDVDYVLSFPPQVGTLEKRLASACSTSHGMPPLALFILLQNLQTSDAEIYATEAK